VHHEVNRSADSRGERAGSRVQVPGVDAVVADTGVDVGELVATAGAERAPDLQESPAMVLRHDFRHRLEQCGMAGQARPERRQRIEFDHVEDLGACPWTAAPLTTPIRLDQGPLSGILRGDR
jgi:hypothetical protein